ncbi:MAG: alpha-E domain-containing protein [Bacteroidota bacterium]
MMLSRVADNLYWMSRYLERAQHTARLLDVTLDLLPERSPDAAAKAWEKLFASLGIQVEMDEPARPFSYMQRLSFDTNESGSIASTIAAARENARQVREEISSEMWEQVNRLYLNVTAANAQTVWAQPHAFFQEVKQGTHLFQGITDSTMNRGQGWQFIQVGQFIERAGNISTLLDVYLRGLGLEALELSREAHQDAVCLLRSCTAWEAYCKVYTANTKFSWIAEFLLLNEEFPHSVHFSVMMVRDALFFIADAAESHKNSNVIRAVGRLKAMLDYGHIDEIISNNLYVVLRDIQMECRQIHTLLYQNYIHYPVDEKLPASSMARY